MLAEKKIAREALETTMRHAELGGRELRRPKLLVGLTGVLKNWLGLRGFRIRAAMRRGSLSWTEVLVS